MPATLYKEWNLYLIQVDECASNPCLNSGTCTDERNNYTCLCPKPWAGQRCELHRYHCSRRWCLNNGACTERALGLPPVCHCKPGTTGMVVIENQERQVW